MEIIWAKIYLGRLEVGPIDLGSPCTTICRPESIFNWRDALRISLECNRIECIDSNIDQQLRVIA
ncbi:hypothetical protein FRX31_014208 [Thalictrum thalictroides]|uniref:Uncharacterized protein n=1 Tax=Thalictrum thalictroides TaxID=46969 RepID=A0A7J6WFL3_THATH|nr:hypothetical protein FRX31_014208 [Thalictrum thalictroides]